MTVRNRFMWLPGENLGIQALLIAVSGAVFAILFVFPPPVAVSSAIFEPTLPMTLLLVVVFWLFQRLGGRVGECLVLTAVMGVFAVSLIYKWQTALYDGNLVGGLLPWSDAMGYFKEVQNILGGAGLSPWGTRRPVFAGLLATLFSLTGRDLQVSMAILVAVNALAVHLAGREVRRTHGPMAASVFVTLCYMFYRTFAGKVLTEHAGFAFGCLGLMFLLRGATRTALKEAAFGLFVLTIALNARAGAFLVLPLLVGWFVFLFRQSRQARTAAAAAVLAVALGFGFNLSLVGVLGSGEGVPFSNYSYVLYGLASGNKGWTQVMSDHPGVSEKEVLGYALEKVRSRPGELVRGILLAYGDYLAPHRGAFGFLRLPQGSRPASIALWLLTLAGWLGALRALGSPAQSLLLFGSCGLVLSVGLVPPIDADGMRAYAATIPFSAFAVSAGVGFLRSMIPGVSRGLAEGGNEPKAAGLETPLAAILLVCSLPLPVIIAVFAGPERLAVPLSCGPGQEQVRLDVGKGSFVELVDDRDSPESLVPRVRLGDFKRSIGRGSLYPELDQELMGLRVGQAIGITSAGVVIAGPHPLQPGAQTVCASPAPTTWLRRYGFFRVDTTGQPGQAGLRAGPRAAGGRVAIALLGGLALSYAAFSVVRASSLMGGWTLASAALWVALVPGLLVYLHSTATLPLRWERVTLPSSTASHHEGFLYTVPLGVNWMSQAKGSSPARIFEDGVELPHPNIAHADIIKRGGGRFSVWEGYLYFSATDNTDVRANGRRYEIYWPTPVSAGPAATAYATSVLATFALAFLHLRARIGRRRAPPG